MSGVAPLLARPDGYDLAGHQIPMPRRTQRDDTILYRQSAAHRPLFHGENDQLDGAADIEVVARYFVAPTGARMGRPARRMRIETHPSPIRGQASSPVASIGKHDIRRSDHM